MYNYHSFSISAIRREIFFITQLKIKAFILSLHSEACFIKAPFSYHLAIWTSWYSSKVDQSRG